MSERPPGERDVPAKSADIGERRFGERPAAAEPPAGEAPDETLIHSLIAAAGDGPTASPEARARVRASVETAWRQAVAARRSRRRRYAGLAAAAVVLLAVAALLKLEPSPSPPGAPPGVRLGAVAKIEGPVYLIRGGRSSVLEPGNGSGDAVRLGDSLHTAAGGKAALELAGGLSLRVDDGTLVTFRSPSEAAVEHGIVYIDAGAEREDAVPFEITTPFGSVRHLGTQYEVTVGDAALRVRVREGSVVIEHGSRRVVGGSGEQITVPRTGSLRRASIATHGSAWAWVEELAAAPPQDPYPLPELLQWIARETGRRLEFSSRAIETRTRGLTLHGVEGLTPAEALAAVRATTGLDYRLHDGVLLVSSAGSQGDSGGTR